MELIMDQSTFKKNCRCCENTNLIKYLDLGKQPLANNYKKNKDKENLFPLEVNLCNKCFHSQLSIVVDPKIMFENYLYVSGTTKTFKTHCQNLAKNAVSMFSNSQLNVLDIAANDGTLLRCFKELGCKVIGVDPAKNLREISKDIEILVDYWSEKMSHKLKNKFDIITGTNVFAHIDCVKSFLNGTKNVLKENGIVILEFPYSKNLISNNEFDTIYHEHLSYFLVNSFYTLVNSLNFKIIKILETPIHGGSIRFFLSLTGDHCKEVFELIEKEKQKGLFKIKTYLDFADEVDKNKKDLNNLIKQIKNNDNYIIGYGASAKSTVMLNYFDIDLDFIVDDNPLKYEMLTPGKNIPIYPTSALKNLTDKTINIIILAWNFREEIEEKINSILSENYKTIYYVPEVNIWQH